MNTKEQSLTNPDHYKQGAVQTIEKMMYAFGPNDVLAFCKLSTFKYIDRAGHKGDPAIDLAKADWYMRLAERLMYETSKSAGLKILKKFLKEEKEKDHEDNTVPQMCGSNT